MNSNATTTNMEYISHSNPPTDTVLPVCQQERRSCPISEFLRTYLILPRPDGQQATQGPSADAGRLPPNEHGQPGTTETACDLDSGDEDAFLEEGLAFFENFLHLLSRVLAMVAELRICVHGVGESLTEDISEINQ